MIKLSVNRRDTTQYSLLIFFHIHTVLWYSCQIARNILCHPCQLAIVNRYLTKLFLNVRRRTPLSNNRVFQPDGNKCVLTNPVSSPHVTCYNRLPTALVCVKIGSIHLALICPIFSLQLFIRCYSFVYGQRSCPPLPFQLFRTSRCFASISNKTSTFQRFPYSVCVPVTYGRQSRQTTSVHQIKRDAICPSPPVGRAKRQAVCTAPGQYTATLQRLSFVAVKSKGQSRLDNHLCYSVSHACRTVRLLNRVTTQLRMRSKRDKRTSRMKALDLSSAIALVRGIR